MDSLSIGSGSDFTPEQILDEGHYFEPVFETFICPLTKEVMKDPVNLENGQTFEREAIENWFEECRNSERNPVCPLTMEDLQSTNTKPNIALKRTILEWCLRNEDARLKHAFSLLSSGSSMVFIIKMFNHIENLHGKGEPYSDVIRKIGVIPLLTEFLRNENRNVRCKALEVLSMLAVDDKNKDMVAEWNTIRTLVKFLQVEFPLERELASRILFELSKSESLCKNIGEINGAIFLLIGIASSTTENMATIQNTEMILQNLAKCKNNVRKMAESGRLQPLLRLLVEGSPESQISMASYLGELVLSDQMKLSVSRTAGPSLVELMKSEDMVAKEMALKALKAVSSCELSAMLLIEFGILPPLMKDLFAIGNKQLPMKLKAFSASILADLVASGVDLESIELGEDSGTLLSVDMIHNLLHLVSNSSPAVGCKLLHVLAELTSSPAKVPNIADAIKKCGATKNFIQFMEVPDADIRLEAIKILHNITNSMHRELTSELCGSSGLSKLVEIASNDGELTEEHAVAIGILAKLPDDDPKLVKCLLQDAMFSTLFAKLPDLQNGAMLGSRLSIQYFEGLVQVISKLTYRMDIQQMVVFAIEKELPLIFANLLMKNGLDNVQVASAKALGNLSKQTKNLSQVPKLPESGCFGLLFPCIVQKPVITGLCKVHSGFCSLNETFCLVEGQLIGRLLAFLDHANEAVVEAALAALCTLLEDGLNIENAALLLADAKGVGRFNQILISKKSELLRSRVIWAIERLVRTDKIASEVFKNPNVRSVLLEVYHNGDARTRKIAEDALKSLDVMPAFSVIF